MNTEPQTESELKTAIDTILREVRHERNRWEDALSTFRNYLEGTFANLARDMITSAAKRERLELQWKLEELLESTAPKPSKPPAKPTNETEPEEPEEAQDVRVIAPLRPEDLAPIYEDPRGIMIHQHKIDGRWFLTQINPMNGQPQTVELSGHQKQQVEAELQGSPYWIE